MPEEQKPLAPVITLVPKQEPQAPQTEPENGVAGAEAMLLDLLEAIQTGRLKPSMMVVHCGVDDTSLQTMSHLYWTWNVRPIEHLGLLDIARFSIMGATGR